MVLWDTVWLVNFYALEWWNTHYDTLHLHKPTEQISVYNDGLFILINWTNDSMAAKGYVMCLGNIPATDSTDWGVHAKHCTLMTGCFWKIFLCVSSVLKNKCL